MSALASDVIAEVEAFAVPDLAVEFTHTLCRTWSEWREGIRAGTTDPATFYKLCDSLASVVLDDFEP